MHQIMSFLVAFFASLGLVSFGILVAIVVEAIHIQRERQTRPYDWATDPEYTK